MGTVWHVPFVVCSRRVILLRQFLDLEPRFFDDGTSIVVS